MGTVKKRNWNDESYEAWMAAPGKTETLSLTINLIAKKIRNRWSQHIDVTSDQDLGVKSMAALLYKTADGLTGRLNIPLRVTSDREPAKKRRKEKSIHGK